MNDLGVFEPTASVLVVPGGLAESLAFREAAMGSGTSLIGASSVANDPAAARYDNWCYLPTVHDADFEDALGDILRGHNIESIYCPHPMMYARLGELSRENGGRFKLLNPPPQAMAERKIASDLRRASEAGDYMRALGGGDVLSEIEVAGLLRASEAIAGQSDETKFVTMMALFAQLPPGDVVEIGTFWGRSAFVLAWLAARHEIGQVLVVDPWCAGDAVQKSAPELVRRDTMAQDWDLIHQGFLLNLLPVAPGRLGYLRMTSAEGEKRYCEAPCRIDSPPFGAPNYSGEISLLHIDGNHDEAAVRLDVSLWTKYLRAGGWLVLDDYVWPHGDGPARAGDALLAELGGRAECCFVAGKALFVRMAQKI